MSVTIVLWCTAGIPLIAFMTSPLRKYFEPRSPSDNLLTMTPFLEFFKVTPRWGETSLVCMTKECFVSIWNSSCGRFTTTVRHMGQRSPEQKSVGRVHLLQVIMCPHGSSRTDAFSHMHTMHSIESSFSFIGEKMYRRWTLVAVSCVNQHSKSNGQFLPVSNGHHYTTVIE